MLASKRTRTVGYSLVAASLTLAATSFADYEYCGPTDTLSKRFRRTSGTMTLRAHPVNYTTNGQPGGPTNARYDNLVRAASEWNSLNGSSVNITVTLDDATKWDDAGEVGYEVTSPDGAGMWAPETLSYPPGWTCGATHCCNTPSGWLVATHVASNIVTFTEYIDDDGNTISNAWDESSSETLVTNKDTIFQQLTGQPWMAGMQHEIGHALSLAHSDDGMARMESHMPSGGWLQNPPMFVASFVPFARDAKDLSMLYADSTTGARSYATQFWSSVLPFDHNQVESSYLIGTLITYSPQTGPVYNYVKYPERVGGPLIGQGSNVVRPGDQFTTKVCYGNRGPTNATVSREILLGSTVISTTNNIANNAYTRQCPLVTLTVPAGTANGSYDINFRLNGGNGHSASRVNRRLTVCSSC